MDSICSLSCLVMILLVCSSTYACKQDSDCGGGGQHCCKSHCTSSKISCNKICFRDEDCSRDHLCTQNMCVACSKKRYDCELKSCYNDTDCPSSLRCSANHMCSKKKPPKQSFTLLPFIIIIAVLGFALLVLCYTEGCWKEILIYLKRYFGRYGRIARDEQEADQRDLCDNEIGSHHRHSNKSCIDARRIAASMTNHTPSEGNNQQPNSNSPNTLRNTRVVSHNRETRTMTLPPDTPSQSRSMTSCTSSSCQQETRLQNSVNSGCMPALSDPHSITRSPSPLPPNYRSLFSEEDESEEPPPKYDDVVKNIDVIPICIEMQSIRPETSAMNHEQDIETTV